MSDLPPGFSGPRRSGLKSLMNHEKTRMTTTVSSNTNTGGIWMIQTYKPQTDLVIADIEALRNGVGGGRV